MATISRRHLVKLLGASAALSGLSGGLSFAAPDPEKRLNLIYIMIDDAGYGDLSAYGRPDYQTPNLDALAAQGVRFTNAYAAAPVCTPTRTGFMTGRYPQRTSVGLEEPIAFREGLGDRIHTVGLAPEHPTVASLLKAAGYETALFGKWHLGYEPQFGPNQHGFDEFFGFLSGGLDYYAHTDGDGAPDLWENDMPVERPGYLTDLLTERAVEYVSSPHSAPFFLSLQYNAPHWPWDTPTHDETVFGSGDRGGGSLEAYAEMMENLDTNIGRLLGAPREADREDDTLIIFTSDNGGERFSYNWPFSGEKFDLHEGGVRVPAIVRWPGVIPAGQVSDQVAITMDWTATLLAAGGAEADTAYPLDGEDLLPVMVGREFVRERTLGSTAQGALRRGDWKYLRSGNDEYLYNLAEDVHEAVDYKELEPRTFGELKSAYDTWNATLLPVLEPETPYLTQALPTAPATTRPAGPAAFHVMVKPGGAICNLDCEYCYFLAKEMLYPGSRFKMAYEVLESYTAQYIAAQRTSEVTFAWQGGEPTLLGLEFFEHAVALQHKHRRKGMRIQNTLQTNGTKLDDAWCAFFKKHDFLIGLSVDGPEHLHDAYRVDKGGKGSFRRVMAGLALLKKHGVEVNILTTLHAANAPYPLEVYSFLRDEVGAQFMQFIPIVERDNDSGFQEGDDLTERSVTAKQYGDFLTEVFDEWVRRDVGQVYVQMFDIALAAWVGMSPGLCVFEKTCGTALALEHNGDVYSCDHYVEPDYLLGNLTELPLYEMAASEQQRAFGQAKDTSLPQYCRDCEVRFVCNGGCPKDRVLRTPDGEPGLNHLCEGYRAFFNHIDPHMRFMAGELQQQRPPANIMAHLAATAPPGAPLGRNAPCPCGSGKKYKHCCGSAKK